MKYLVHFIIITSIISNQACKTSSPCFKEPRAVFNADVGILPKYVCGLEKRFSPYMDEVEFAEAAICNSDTLIQKFFYDSRLKNYRRKFIGFMSENGEKIVVVSLEHKKLFKDKKGDVSTYFETEFVQGYGEAFEKYQRILTVNLVTGKVSFPCNK